MEKKDRITAEDLRGLSPGQSATFELGSTDACVNARALCASYGFRLGCKFACSVDRERLAVTITRRDG